MLSNREYLRQFIKKHHYDTNIRVQCYKEMTDDRIKTVVFNKKDIPSGKKVSIEDIRYDIDTMLPEDVFYRWLQYCDANPDSDVSYIHWMTKMDNKYQPMDLDVSESYKVRDMIYSKLNELKNNKWF